LNDDADFIVEKLPEVAHKLQHRLGTFRAEGPTLLEQVEKAAKELEKAAVDFVPYLGTMVILPACGIAGFLLGAPLLAVAKVVCDRIESLKPVGEMLGR
jgi:hypothetical protein